MTGLHWPKALSARILPLTLTSNLLQVNKTKKSISQKLNFLTSVTIACYLLIVFTFIHLNVVFDTKMIKLYVFSFALETFLFW